MQKDIKGFTLIELMIVVAIIGILATIAIPNFMSYQCRAKQSEAKIALSHLRAMEESYYAEHDTYTANLKDIGFSIEDTSSRYKYNIIEADTSKFTAKASGNIDRDDTIDEWTIDQDNTLTNNKNDCKE